MTPPDVALPEDLPVSTAEASTRPDRETALDAVRTLLRFVGEDPDREGLVETPDRVLRSYKEFFGGYEADPAAILAKTFEETDGYDEMVMLRNIRFVSHCEHHMVPITGEATVAYLPRHRVVGVSKIARIVDLYARRLQIQERFTAQIAETLDSVLDPLGVAVVVRAQHQCMTTRGVNKPDASMVTTRMLGVFKDDRDLRREFMALGGIE